MFFQDFQAWKLHTWQDYIYFFMMAFSCFALFFLIIKSITKRRNDIAALKRVKRKLRVKNGKVYHNVTFNFGGQQVHFDHLLVDAAGLVAVRSIGWGIRIYGAAEDETWKVSDNKTENVRIENPIRALKQHFEPMRRGLSQGNIYGVAIEPLTIFADPFAPPELYLGRDSGCIPFEQLGAWLKFRRMRAAGKTDKLNVSAVIDYLDSLIVAEKPA